MNILGIVLDDIYSSEAPNTPPRDRRWMVITFEEKTKAFGAVGAQLATVWVYQPEELGVDYGTIDLIITRVRELLETAQHVVGADGWILTAASWQADSPDLRDRSFDALTRYSRHRVAARHVITP
jgi:hypothetical protein